MKLIFLFSFVLTAQAADLNDFKPCVPSVVTIWVIEKIEVAPWDEESGDYDTINRVTWWGGSVIQSQAMFYWNTTPGGQQEWIQKPAVADTVIVPAKGSVRTQQKIVGTAIMIKSKE